MRTCVYELRMVSPVKILRCMNTFKFDSWRVVSRFGLAVRLVSRGTSVQIRFGSPFSSKFVVCGHCLVTLSLTIMKH